jgi:hypothetical protein
MRSRSTIVLVLLLLGLGAYVYWVELPKAEQEAKKKTLFEFKAEDAAEVALVYADREITVKKSGDDWRLTKPIDVAADSTTVKNLVNAIAECEVKKELTDASSDLAQYGLDQPLVKVTVKLKDKELPTVLVGKNTPVGFSTYVQKADDKKVLLTASAFRSGMDKSVKDLRDKTILSFADKDVQKIVLLGDGKDITLVQKDDAWNIEAPAAYKADATTLRTFLSTLRSMRAVDFPEAPSDPSAYGLDTPRLKVTFYLGKDSAEKTLLLGKETEKKEVYVQASGQPPTVYTVSDWVFRDLNKNVADFRDKTLLTFDHDKVTAVELKRKDGAQVKLVRGDNKQWRIEGAGEGKPADTTISQYVADLQDLKGYEIAAEQPTDLAQFGLDQPLLALTVYAEENKTLGTVRLGLRPGTEAKKEYTAMTEGGATAFLIRDYLFTRLDKQPQDFLEKPTPTAGANAPPAQIGAEPLEDEPEGEPPDED